MAAAGEAAAFEQISYSVDAAAGVCTVELNRPRLRNAISRIMTLELDGAFAMACNDPAVRTIVLLGAGDHFSSGHDLGSKEQLADLAANSYKSMGYDGPWEGALLMNR